MYLVILTFILLTARDHIALINYLSIYFQTTPQPATLATRFHCQLQQENKRNTDDRKSAETSSYAIQQASPQYKCQLLQKQK
jgi:hypothetical protein